MDPISEGLRREIQRLLLGFARVLPVRRAYLYGSRARGEGRPDSDLDIALFSDVVSERNRLDLVARCLLAAACSDLDVQVRVYPLDDLIPGQNGFVTQEIVGRGIEIPLSAMA